MELNQSSLERYIEAARDAGCPADQVQNFVSGGYISQPRQLLFHAAARMADMDGGPTEIGFGGARGPGKSHASMDQVGLDDCQRVPGLKVLFLRSVQKAARESFEDLIRKALSGVERDYQPSNSRLVFPNESRIVLGGFRNEKDIDAYLGIEYDVIVIEEANLLSEKKFEMLLGSLRTSKPNWRPRVYLTFNPGGIGHQWVKKRYIMPWREKRETYTRFVFATYKDNVMTNKEYAQYLENLSGALGKAWRDGDWDTFEGMAFPAWNYETHVCKPFEIPAHWSLKTGTDWGSTKPFANVWIAKNPDNGRVVMYRELYQAGLSDRRQAELIRDRENPEEYRRIAKRYADPSMWTADTRFEHPTSSADIYRQHGVLLTRASNDRKNGKRKVERLLDPLPDGLPGFMVFETCFNFINNISSLVYSQTDPEDVDTDGEDHDYDALRYALSDEKDHEEPKPKSAQRSPVLSMRSI